MSLRRRTVVLGVVAVGLALGLSDTFLFVAVREEQLGDVETLLDERTEIARALAARLPPEEVVDWMEEAGVPVRVVLPDGRTLGGDPGAGPDASRSRVLALGDGAEMTVLASSAGADRALRQLLLLEVAGTVAALVLTGLLLARTSSLALRPLDEPVSAARRSAGERGVRVEPGGAGADVGRVADAPHEVTGALEAALGHARASAAVNQTFLADAAHQLRTPITAMRAAAEVLAMDLDAAERRRATSVVVDQAERVGHLLGGLLRMAKLDQGEVPAREPFDMEALCRTEVEHARALSPAVDIRMEGDAGRASPVELDPRAMREVIGNLLDNARRHARSRIVLLLDVTETTIEVRLIDDGQGMSAEESDAAFRRFVSLDVCGGSGLGLPIARGIIEAHGGSLTYEDRQFVICLPRERRRRPRPHSPPAQVAAGRTAAVRA